MSDTEITNEEPAKDPTCLAYKDTYHTPYSLRISLSTKVKEALIEWTQAQTGNLKGLRVEKRPKEKKKV